MLLCSRGEGGGLRSPVVPPDAEVLGREEARVERDLVRVRVRVRVRGLGLGVRVSVERDQGGALGHK